MPAVTLDLSYVAALLIAIGLHVLSGAIDHSGDIKLSFGDCIITTMKNLKYNLVTRLCPLVQLSIYVKDCLIETAS